MLEASFKKFNVCMLMQQKMLVCLDESCLPGWQEFNSYCYTVIDESVTFEAARNICISFGGDIASIHSNNETEFIVNEGKKVNK